jgi:methanogenic corrinoid protein MtbC1
MAVQVEAVRDALLALDRLQAEALLQAAVRELSPLVVVETLVRPALEEIGELWDQGACALSQVYMSGRICEQALDQLLAGLALPGAAAPAMPQTPAGLSAPRLAIVVLDDFHLLGKQIVHTVMRASGYAIKDYGRQTLEPLVDRVCEDEIEVLLVSTLMLHAALGVEGLVKRLKQDSPGTRVIVGGAPYRFDDQLWREVGADAVGRNAGEVVGLVERLTGVTV